MEMNVLSPKGLEVILPTMILSHFEHQQTKCMRAWFLIKNTKDITDWKKLTNWSLIGVHFWTLLSLWSYVLDHSWLFCSICKLNFSEGVNGDFCGSIFVLVKGKLTFFCREKWLECLIIFDAGRTCKARPAVRSANVKKSNVWDVTILLRACVFLIFIG